MFLCKRKYLHVGFLNLAVHHGVKLSLPSKSEELEVYIKNTCVVYKEILERHSLQTG